MPCHEKPLLSTVVLWYWSPTHAHKRTNAQINRRAQRNAGMAGIAGLRLQSMLTLVGVPKAVGRAIVRGLDAKGVARVRAEVEHLAARASADHTADGTESESESVSDTQSDLDWVASPPGSGSPGARGGDGDGGSRLGESESDGLS